MVVWTAARLTEPRPAPAEFTLEVVDDELEVDDGESFPSVFVGPALRTARLRARLSQGDIARYFNIDSSIPSRWEGFDAQHNGRTTRYKPVPTKYLRELSQLLNCPLEILAPELAAQLAAWAAASSDWPTPRGSCPAADATSASLTAASSGSTGGAETISSYTVGGASLHASPVPGRPPTEMLARGEWRRRCPGCHKVFVESAAVRAPSECDVCHGPVRATSTISLRGAPPPT